MNEKQSSRKNSYPTLTRRDSLRLAAGTGVGLILATTSVTAQTGDEEQDWPMYLGDARNNGRFNSKIDFIGEEFNENTLASFDGSRVTGPILDNGDFYICSYREDDYSVYRVRNGNKNLIVTAEYEDDSTTPNYSDTTVPAVSNGIIYIVTTYGINAFDIETGEKIWFANLRNVHSPPTIFRDSVYVAIPTWSFGGSFVSIGAQNGEIEWEYDTGATSHASDNFAVAATENNVILSDNDGYVNSVSPETGDVNWEFSVETPTGANPSPGIPSISNDTIYCNMGGRMVALDLNSGDLLWEFSYDAGHSLGSPAIGSDKVIGFDDLGKVYGLNLQDGSLEWNTSVLGSSGGKIVLSEDIILFHNHEQIDLINFDSGEVLDSIEFDDTAIRSMGPLTSEGIFAITRSEDGILALSVISERLDSEEPADGETGEPAGDEVEESGNEGIATTLFSAEDGAAGNPLLVGGGGVATVGVGYLAYKKLQDSDESSTEPTPTSSSSDDSVSPSESSTSAFSVNQYDALNIGDTVRQYPTTEIRQATTTGHPVWVLTPTSENETVETTQLEQFSDEIESWASMDAHEHLLSVYGHGDEPLPWAAVEPADTPSLAENPGSLTTRDLLEILTQACDGVHHVQRYGIAYEQLSADSVLVADGKATLRGLLDHINTNGSGYELPTSDEDPTAEQADVYRLGALVYEVLTGELPEHPNPTSPSTQNASLSGGLDEIILKALATDPQERHETVLHLRDELQDCIDTV